jgi:hypothetical protein
MNTENIIPEDKDKSFHPELESLPLSDKLKQKGLVQSITIDKKANMIKVVLNHGSNTLIVSTIYPIWNKTLRNFEKRAKSKKISDDDIIDIQDVLDDNHEILNNHFFDSSSHKTSQSQITDKEKEETLTAIEKIRSDHKDITPDEWRDKLLIKCQSLKSAVDKNLANLWPSLEFESSIQKILNIKDCTLPFAGKPDGDVEGRACFRTPLGDLSTIQKEELIANPDNIDNFIYHDPNRIKEDEQEQSEENQLHVISKSISRISPHSDTWTCHNCNIRGDKWFMMVHNCELKK